MELADDFVVMMEMDIRSAHNVARLQKMLAEQRVPCRGLRHVLNRAPGFTDRAGRARMKQLGDQLGTEFDLRLPDGGKSVAQAAQDAMPLALAAPKNPLRKEIMRIAAAIAVPARPGREAA